MTKRRSIPLRAFTLIETIAVILVMGVLASVATPIILSTSGLFASASLARERTEDASMALERIVRALRESPDRADDIGTPDIIRATSSAIEFGNGTSIELIDTTLWLAAPTETASPLCQHVETFTFTYLNSTGDVIDTSVVDAALNTNRINIQIHCQDGAELRTSVFLRCTLGGS